MVTVTLNELNTLLREYIESAASQFEDAQIFYGHGTDNAWDEAVYLVFSGLGLSYQEDDSIMSHVLTDPELTLLDELVARRINERVPVAYLVGEAWFAGLPFTVDSRVLIPRSPIAELIADNFRSVLPEPPNRILDLCTGSGCIGIACAVAFPNAQVDLADISADALSVARENAKRHRVDGRVNVIQSDLMRELQPGYDLIVTNPPYVSRDEIADLPDEYQHEPELGLLSADEGLEIPLTILRYAADYLAPEGVLILEVGYSRAALVARLPQMPFLWLEFENGGDGVCMLTAEQLSVYRAQLA